MKKLCIVLAIALSMVLQFCSSSKKAHSPVAAAKVTYLGNVQPTIVANCRPCHIPPKGLKNALDNYDSVRLNIDDIIARIQKQPGEQGFMPFKHPRLSDSTIMVFVNFKKYGLIEK